MPSIRTEQRPRAELVAQLNLQSKDDIAAALRLTDSELAACFAHTISPAELLAQRNSLRAAGEIR